MHCPWWDYNKRWKETGIIIKLSQRKELAAPFHKSNRIQGLSLSSSMFLRFSMFLYFLWCVTCFFSRYRNWKWSRKWMWRPWPTIFTALLLILILFSVVISLSVPVKVTTEINDTTDTWKPKKTYQKTGRTTAGWPQDNQPHLLLLLVNEVRKMSSERSYLFSGTVYSINPGRTVLKKIIFPDELKAFGNDFECEVMGSYEIARLNLHV